MGSPRAVSVYRTERRLWVRLKSGVVKSFAPTLSSQRRIHKVLSDLDRAGRVGFGIASLFGLGAHFWIDPVWLQKDR